MEISIKNKAFALDKKLNILIPYVLLFVTSLFATWLLMYKGYPTGDDIHYHFSNIYDMYQDLKDGSLEKISTTMASSLGFGKNLFYSPLSHLTTVLLAMLLEPFGVTLLQAFKLNLFLSVFLSGVFSYQFGMRISKRRMAALLGAMIYVLYPYRYFDMFCRLAIAEAYAFLFIPIFFMGLYDLIHLEDEKYTRCFLEIILGGSLLFLTHNITAVYAYFFGIFYLLFHIRRIIALCKENVHILPMAVISGILLLGITAGTLFSALSLYSTGIYNVSNADRMWTSKEYLTGRTDFNWYSGVLNLDYFNSFDSGITTNTAIYDGLVYGLLTLGIVFVLELINTFVKNKAVRIGVVALGALISITVGCFLFQRTEVVHAVLLFQLVYLYLKKQEKKKSSFISYFILGGIGILFYVLSMLLTKATMFYVITVVFAIYALIRSVGKDKDKDYWFYVLALFLTLILITVGGIWQIMPSTLRSIQFPWRLWCYASFFAAILAVYMLRDLKFSSFTVLAVSMTCFLLVVSQPLAEKQIAYHRAQEGSSDSWTYEISDEYYTKSQSIGACREYFPYMFYYSDEYEATYTNSLYNRVKRFITNSSYIGKKQNISPVFLEGNGIVLTHKNEAPNLTMEIVVEEDSFVQLPLIYYPGYTVYAIDSSGHETKLEALMVDGLVAFHITEGRYLVHTEYKGTGLMRFGEFYQSISIYSLFIFGCILLLYENKKKNFSISFDLNR